MDLGGGVKREGTGTRDMKVERSLEMKGDQQEDCRAGEGGGRGTISMSFALL